MLQKNEIKNAVKQQQINLKKNNYSKIFWMNRIVSHGLLLHLASLCSL